MLDDFYQAGADEAFDEIMSKLGSDSSIDYLDELVDTQVNPGMEKEAFISAALRGLSLVGKGLSRGATRIGAGKGFRAGFRAFKAPLRQGWRGYRNTMGGRFLRNTANWLGMGGNRSMFIQAPLLFGGIGAATAEPGKRTEGALKGALGALALGAGIKFGGKVVGGGLGMGARAIGKTKPMQSAWKGLGNVGKVNPQTGLTAVQQGLKTVGGGALAAGSLGGGFYLTMNANKLTDPVAEALARKTPPKYAFGNTLQVPQGMGNNPFNPMY